MVGGRTGTRTFVKFALLRFVRTRIRIYKHRNITILQVVSLLGVGFSRDKNKISYRGFKRPERSCETHCESETRLRTQDRDPLRVQPTGDQHLLNRAIERLGPRDYHPAAAPNACERPRLQRCQLASEHFVRHTRLADAHVGQRPEPLQARSGRLRKRRGLSATVLGRRRDRQHASLQPGLARRGPAPARKLACHEHVVRAAREHQADGRRQGRLVAPRGTRAEASRRVGVMQHL